MSDYLPVPRSPLWPSRQQREVDRVRRAIMARAEIAMLRDRAEIARIRTTGKAGMQAVYDVSAEEAQLAHGNPFVQARLCMVADATALCIRTVVADTTAGL